MGKLLLIYILLLFNCASSFSQGSTKDFEIPLSKQKIENSLYKTIGFIDSRYDTTNMGILPLLGRKSTVIANIPLSIQLTRVINSLTDSTSKDGELVFQLRKLHFVVVTGTPTRYKEGYCYLRAVLYSKRKNYYQKIASIDTVITSEYLELTKVLLKDEGEMIANFIATNLSKEATDSNYYSLNDIVKLDSIEKRKMKLYNTLQYTDGLYACYKSFVNQTPDRQIIVEMKDTNIASVKTFNDKGKEVKVKEKDIYSIVYQGQPFILTASGYHPLVKRNDDFFYIDKPDALTSGDYVVEGLANGLIGDLILSTRSNPTFEMRIDHISGRPIHFREIKDTTN